MDLRTYLNLLPAGGKSAFARAIGIAPAYLYQLSVGLREVSPRLALKMAVASKGNLTPHELRPDLYPNPTDGLPPKLREEAA